MKTSEEVPAPTKAEGKRQIKLPPSITVKQFADLVEASAVEVIKQLMRNGIMASINQVIDYDTAAIVASDFGYAALVEKELVSYMSGEG